MRLDEVEQVIRQFAADHRWTFAKSMPEIPHEYVVRQRLANVGQDQFDVVGGLIARYGYERQFGRRTFKYVNCDGYRYWRIGNILNRAKLTDP